MLLHQPEILVLDEPTSGLDPNQILAIRNLVRRIGAKRTVLLSTHILQEVEATCDRVLILNRGQLVADAPIAEVRAAREGGTLVKVTFAPGAVRLPADKVRALVLDLPGVVRAAPQAEAEPDTVPLEVVADRDLRRDLFDLATAHGLRLAELARGTSTLEQVFRRLTAEDVHPDRDEENREEHAGDQ